MDCAVQKYLFPEHAWSKLFFNCIMRTCQFGSQRGMGRTQIPTSCHDLWCQCLCLCPWTIVYSKATWDPIHQPPPSACVLPPQNCVEPTIYLLSLSLWRAHVNFRHVCWQRVKIIEFRMNYWTHYQIVPPVPTLFSNFFF